MAINKGEIPNEFNAEDYFDVFQLALESRFPRVIEAALDGLYDLFEGGFLQGNAALEHTALVTKSKYKSSASLAGVEAPEILMDHVVLKGIIKEKKFAFLPFSLLTSYTQGDTFWHAQTH